MDAVGWPASDHVSRVCTAHSKDINELLWPQILTNAVGMCGDGHGSATMLALHVGIVALAKGLCRICCCSRAGLIGGETP